MDKPMDADVPDLREGREEVLDYETMKKVAAAVTSGKRLRQLAQQLNADYNNDFPDGSKGSSSNPTDQALEMLKNWRKAFTRLNPVETLWKAALTIGLDLSKELGHLQQSPPCSCGNNNSLKFRRYFNHSQKDPSPLIGICCVPCGQEWLEDKYLFHPDRENKRKTVEVDGVVLKKQLEVPIEKSPIFKGNGLIQEIGPDDPPTVGDHIAWERPYVIWHHAIVSEVKGLGVIKVIHWSKVKWRSFTKQIKEEEIHLANQKGKLYRHRYGEEMTNANPTELVIARAKCRIDDNRYSIADDNCESFASYCKIGVAESSQIQKVKEVATLAIGKITETALVNIVDIKLIDSLSQSNKTIAYIIISMVGFACYLNLSEAYKQRKQDKLSLEEFAQIVTLRVSTELVIVGLAAHAGGSVAGSKFLGLAVGDFAGWIVDYSVNSIAVKPAGSFIGPPIGRAIARAIGTDDRVVHIVDLNPGDQIVVYSKLLHPRHHAIVVSCDQENKKVKVIHSTYGKGIVEEEVDFLDPVYKVIYNQDCFPPEQVIARARSESDVRGVNKYSLVSNNCKHFAQRCKLKKYSK